MKLLLKDFQERAVDDFVRQLHLASAEVRESPRSTQAVWLSAATGSGKTLIATATIERILTGDETYRPMPQATFLWLSDQPELNEQTRKKMLAFSSVLGPSELVVIDASFDAETLTPGRIHFLNIQKLGKEATLVASGDKRGYTIWQTLANTISRRGHEFFLLIDEAHRGTIEKPAAREEASTIVQKFIKGSSSDGLPPVPLISGISATPERFQRVIIGAARVQRPVEVPTDDVRASGLLKDFIDVYHPRRAQTADMTMLAQAAKSWHEMWTRWEDFCRASGDPTVRPILVIQVEDGTARQVSKTPLDTVLGTIRRAVGKDADRLLPPRAFAHAFQEGRTEKVGDTEIRHLSPSEIVEDPEVRVVLFKTSLNTGWDCPSAETMMSFRTALDPTSIAQLVGRMVRTPLARRIEADESLNRVALYLPHYDADNLDKVVARLTGDPDMSVPVEIRRGEDVIDLLRAPKSDAYFDALFALPSYVVPKVRRTSEVRRLVKLAFHLTNDGIDEGAIDAAARLLVGVLRSKFAEDEKTEGFKRFMESATTVEIGGRRVRLGVAEEGELEERTATRAVEDIDEQFEEAGRKLGEGLHKAWWRERVEADEEGRTRAKLEIVALADDPSVVASLEDTARITTQAWLKQWRKEIRGLPEADRQAYVEIRALASQPEVVDREPYPDRTQTARADKLWAGHVYVDENGKFPSKFNKWETKVIRQELEKRGEVVAWLRNPPRKPWSLTVPYWRGGEHHPEYPDFLVLRKTNKGVLVVDLLDPHMADLGDAAAKAVGLAKFAELHQEAFGRIEFMIVDDDRVISLDMTDEVWRQKVLVFGEGGDAEKLKLLLKEAAAAPARA